MIFGKDAILEHDLSKSYLAVNSTRIEPNLQDK